MSDRIEGGVVTVTESAWQRFKKWFFGLFSESRRSATATEIRLIHERDRERQRAERAEREAQALRRDCEAKQSEIDILQTSVSGLSLVVERNHQHWRAETAIDALRISAAQGGQVLSREDIVPD